MASQLKMNFDFQLSPKIICDQMRSVALIEASEKSRGALEVTVTELYQDEHRHEYQIDVVNYARSVKGEDRSKTEKGTTTVKWDLKTHTRHWTWSGNHPVNLRGEDTITGDDAHSVLMLKADIEVKIPIVGRVVAKLLKSGFEQNWPKYAKLIAEFANAAQ